jgi:hypothetical protein
MVKTIIGHQIWGLISSDWDICAEVKLGLQRLMGVNGVQLGCGFTDLRMVCLTMVDPEWPGDLRRHRALALYQRMSHLHGAPVEIAGKLP